MKKGFTLIELLIVIAIIGILTTVLLQNLNTSRQKAYDSQVKQQLRNFRSAAELYYGNQSPNGYGPAASDCTSGIFADNSPSNGNPASYLNITTPGVSVVCGSTNTAYAVKATLLAIPAGAYWCSDSRGISEQVLGPIGGSVTVCP